MKKNRDKGKTAWHKKSRGKEKQGRKKKWREKKDRSKKREKKKKEENKKQSIHSALCFGAWSFLLSCCPRSRDTLRTSNCDLCFGYLFNFAALFMVFANPCYILSLPSSTFLCPNRFFLAICPRSKVYHEPATGWPPCCVGKNTCKHVVRCLSVSDSTSTAPIVDRVTPLLLFFVH
jgi:hypothetical protein